MLPSPINRLQFCQRSPVQLEHTCTTKVATRVENRFRRTDEQFVNSLKFLGSLSEKLLLQEQATLRQGDSMSPYLFILIADILQRLILHASASGLLHHPLDSSLPCPVLQYADDTLIILQASLEQLTHLKTILLEFSAATGLQINFHKSTFAPIHVDDALASSMAAVLGCPVASFPQSYLGLPLSTHKLNLSAFFFIIDKVDRRLAGWRGLLLSLAGRAILVRAVLRALPLYAMSALLLPLGTIQAIDSRCRAFFWADQDTISGGQCKVAWDAVCAPFSRGGLGFLSLHQFNQCLLLK